MARRDSGWTFDRADLDDGLLFAFRVGAARYGVHYPLTDLPNGPNTGMPRDTPDEWAVEVALDIDEQVDTGGIAHADRVGIQNETVLLRWRW